MMKTSEVWSSNHDNEPLATDVQALYVAIDIICKNEVKKHKKRSTFTTEKEVKMFIFKLKS